MGTPQDNTESGSSKRKSGWLLDELEGLVQKAPNTPLRFRDIHSRFNIHPETLRRWALNAKLKHGPRQLWTHPRIEGQTTAIRLWEALDGRPLP